VVVLDKDGRDAAGAVFLGVVRLDEDTAAVPVHVRFDDEHSGDDGRDAAHANQAS
jgi:hypothetical protein